MRLPLLWSLLRRGPEWSEESVLLLREECRKLSELILRRESVGSRGEITEHERTVALSMQLDHWRARVRKDPSDHSIFTLIYPGSELVPFPREELCAERAFAGFYARGELRLESRRVLSDDDAIYSWERSLWM